MLRGATKVLRGEVLNATDAPTAHKMLIVLAINAMLWILLARSLWVLRAVCVGP